MSEPSQSDTSAGASPPGYEPSVRTIRDPGPLRLLCFDGGGVRGLSSLLILREILFRAQNRPEFLKTGKKEILPCEYFDMICGTSTGGLIAIMLGKLRMSIDQAIKAYTILSKDIFSTTKWFWKEGRYFAAKLEHAINKVIGDRARLLGWESEHQKIFEPQALGRSIMMRGENPDEDACKVFVCARNAANSTDKVLIRTYSVTKNQREDFAVWEAARATSAAPTFFKPMVISAVHGRTLQGEFIDGGLGMNNPVMKLIYEAQDRFEVNREIGFVLSLGTGHKDSFHLPRAGRIPKLQLWYIVNLLKELALDCEAAHEEAAKYFRTKAEVYFRFNVDSGLQKMGLADWDRIPELEGHTNAYLLKEDVGRGIDKAVDSFFRKSVASVYVAPAPAN